MSEEAMSPVFQGSGPFVEAPKGNLIKFIFKDAHKWSNRTALICGITNASMTFAKLQDQMGRWGYWLTHRSGVFTPHHSVVALLSDPCVEYALVQLGTISVGGAVSYLDSFGVPGELSHQLNALGASLMVVSEALEDKLIKAFAVLGRTIPYVVIGRSNREVAGRYHDIVSDTSLQVMEPLELSGEETMIYFHTSGSTGLPKLVQHCHRSVAHTIAILSHPYWNPTRPTTEHHQDRALLNRHFGGVFAFQRAMLPGLALGVCQVIKDLDEATLGQDIIRYQINQILVVPPTLPIVLRIAKESPTALIHLRRILVGGAPIPMAVAEAIMNAAPSVLFQTGYGMTELLAVACDPVTGGKPGHTGQLLFGTQVKVVDVNSRQLLPAGREGVIFVQTTRVMQGYLHNIKATEKVLGPDGWFDTGDIGLVDDEGFVKITDRERELIKAKDVLAVSPTELENALLEHPQVKEACVVGVLQPKTGLDSIWAFVSLFEEGFAIVGTGHTVTKEAGQVTEETIKEVIKNKFNEAKHLDAVNILEKLPKNRNGKIDRKLLKEQAKSLQI